jgi:hypothetical protein
MREETEHLLYFFGVAHEVAAIKTIKRILKRIFTPYFRKPVT